MKYNFITKMEKMYHMIEATRGKIYTVTQWKECLFNCIFFFYVLCILILEGLILKKTKLLVGLSMTVNEDQTCS